MTVPEGVGRHRHSSRRRVAVTGGLLLAVAAALVSLAEGAGPLPSSIGAVAAALVFACAVLVARGSARARSRRHEDDEARRARREAAVRILWAASGDFLAAGWGRNDLERLRLLALNVTEGQVLGPRMAERLRAAAHAVTGSVVDRLGDVVVTAREAGFDGACIGRLEASVRVLVSELERGEIRSGAPVAFRPQALAAAAGRAVEGCAELREDLRPHVISEVHAVMRWLADGRQRARVGSGELLIDLSGIPAGTRVAARPSDLTQALDELVGALFARGPVPGPVRLSCRLAGRDALLSLTWPGRERFQADPRVLAEPLRVLTSYGARITLSEHAPDGMVGLEAALPLATAPGDATPVHAGAGSTG